MHRKEKDTLKLFEKTWLSVGWGGGGGPQRAFYFQNVHQLRANDCQNCSLWVR